MWGIDKLLSIFRKKKESKSIDFSRDAYGRIVDRDDSYTSCVSQQFDERVWKELVTDPAHEQELKDEEYRAVLRKRKRDADTDSR